MSICSTGLGDALKGTKPLAVTVKNACHLMGIGNTKAYELFKEGKLQTVTIGRRRLVVFASIEKLMGIEADA
jgi:excisionase family DNA binding protein